MTIFRLALFAVLLMLGTTAHAQQAIKPQTIDLWPGAPPGTGRPTGPEKVDTSGSATGAVSNVTRPRIELYRPAKPNGKAVLVIGGGGYFRIQIGGAAVPTARVLLARGYTVGVLYYRLPGDGWNADAPFQDGQRAMRILADQAAGLGVRPDGIGVVGFSAGGHLAAMLATQGNETFYTPIDATDRRPAVPAFAGLIYPVISMKPPIDTTRTKRELQNLPNFLERFSAEDKVSARTPPIFLAHAADDRIADVDHSLRMFRAMREAGRPVELHVFEQGGHSWGVGKPGTTVSAWPNLFLRWLDQAGVPTD